MVEANGLCMNYGQVVALSNASFKAVKGEILGLLGPNGAGKTTTMKILTTQILPTSGNATVADFDLLKDPIEIRRRVGYLPEIPPVYPEMEVAEYLDFVGRARGLAPPELKRRIDYTVNACGLREVFRTTVGTLSRGYGQRTGLAQALIHDPEILILDEPTSGLDPIQIIGIRDLVKSLAHDKTVIFSTHILQEVEAISDRVVIINEGIIVADGSIDELRSQAKSKQRFLLVVSASEEDLRNALDGLRERFSFDYDVSKENGFSRATIETEGIDDLWSGLSETVHRNGWVVRQFFPERRSLEEAFRYHVKHGSGEKSDEGRAVQEE
jgi:ABC-2 type transport system ATP-binding protein